MRPTPAKDSEDSDLVQTLPVTGLTKAEVATLQAEGWDEEAPTAVNTGRPLFAGPPRLPST
jgi:hypothetical protein